MSTILDALKKVEQQRRNQPEKGVPPGVRAQRSESGKEARSDQPGPKKWIRVISAVVLVAGLSAAGWVYFKSRSSTTPTGSAETPMQTVQNRPAPPPEVQSAAEPVGEKTANLPPAPKATPSPETDTGGPLKIAAKSEPPATPTDSVPEPPPAMPAPPPRGKAPPRIETAPPQVEMAAPLPDAWDGDEKPQPPGTDGPGVRVSDVPSPSDMPPAMVEEALEPPSPPPEAPSEIVEEDLNPPPPDSAPEEEEPRSAVPTVVPPLNDPKITLQALAWTAEPERRMVVINGTVLREGDDLGPYIIGRIEKEQVVLVKSGVEAALSISRLR